MSSRLSRRCFVAGAVGLPIALALSAKARAAAKEPVLHEVAIEGFRFQPARLEVRPGDIIRWTNEDLAPHTATAEDGSWDTGELALGASAEITVTADMTGSYFCAFHPQMRGRLLIS